MGDNTGGSGSVLRPTTAEFVPGSFSSSESSPPLGGQGFFRANAEEFVPSFGAGGGGLSNVTLPVVLQIRDAISVAETGHGTIRWVQHRSVQALLSSFRPRWVREGVMTEEGSRQAPALSRQEPPLSRVRALNLFLIYFTAVSLSFSGSHPTHSVFCGFAHPGPDLLAERCIACCAVGAQEFLPTFGADEESNLMPGPTPHLRPAHVPRSC
eukprot:3108249-Rhodomonas_salina.2